MTLHKAFDVIQSNAGRLEEQASRLATSLAAALQYRPIGTEGFQEIFTSTTRIFSTLSQIWPQKKKNWKESEQDSRLRERQLLVF